MTEPLLDFEKPLIQLEEKITELHALASKNKKIDLSVQIKELEKKAEELKRDIYLNLTPWQRVLVARHLHRPHTLDYINSLFQDFMELHGDRNYCDDTSMIAGLAKFEGTPVAVVGHQKGKDTKENIKRNFGMPHPEGYRKALRVMKLAEKFGLPVISFIDTPAAYPGVGAEERGQGEAIARNLREMAVLRVPILVVVIGEGGSGGALGIGVGDRILMLENAVYSVISPEGCATILWNDRLQAPKAAEYLKLTALDLLKNRIVDEVVPEPPGGAHRDAPGTLKRVQAALKANLAPLVSLDREQLLRARYDKFRKLGDFEQLQRATAQEPKTSDQKEKPLDA